MKILETLSSLRNMFLFVTALAGAFGTVYASVQYVDSRYALAEVVTKLEKRLSLTELKELLRKALENLYFYRDQERKYPDDQEIKKRVKEAQEEVDDLKEQIKELEKTQ